MKKKKDLVKKTKNDILKISNWFKQQRRNALKGVYSKKSMSMVRSKHTKRLDRAKQDTRKYIMNIKSKYFIYKGLFQE
jgi:hypothetical protein